MTKFIPIYAMTKGNFFRMEDEPVPTIAEVLAHDSGYVIMPKVMADREEVYEILNIRHPKEFVDFVNALHETDHEYEKYPRLHTSLSVGDIVVECVNESATTPIFNYWFCDNCGWIELQ
jgi:hypothetical protein